MKKTFKQFNIEQKAWDTFFEQKGYKKKKKEKPCECQDIHEFKKFINKK